VVNIPQSGVSNPIYFIFQIQGEAQLGHGAQAVRYRGVFGTITTMVRTEGARSLYSGLVAGLQRQMSFASVRIGLYDSMKQFYTHGSDSRFYNPYII
jgi:solute carrier family 25 uncoupling protein 8/9